MLHFAKNIEKNVKTKEPFSRCGVECGKESTIKINTHNFYMLYVRDVQPFFILGRIINLSICGGRKITCI